MIAEQTSLHTPTHSTTTPYVHAIVGEEAEFTGLGSTGWRKRLTAFVQKPQKVAIALLAALVAASSPSYFDHTRPDPVQRRLGPGLSRESDSFWPLSEW